MTITNVGETSRTPYTRGAEHLAAYRNHSQASFQWRHCVAAHNGVLVLNNGEKDFKMEGIVSYKKSLTRVLEVVVLIQEAEMDKDTNCLNSKEEYYGAQCIRPLFFQGLRE